MIEQDMKTILENITAEKLRSHSIFVATPMYGGECSGVYTKSCTDLALLCGANGIKIRFYYLFNESLVQRARNYCVDEFLRSDYTHFLFIDADIGFNAKDALALLGIQINEPDKYDIIAGPYPKKTIAWEKIEKASQNGYGKESPFGLEQFVGDFVFNPIKTGSRTFSLNEPIEVAEAGTGFMMMPRRVFEQYAEAYPELRYTPDHVRTESFDGSRQITAFFDCVIDPDSNRYLSEDYFFCKMARKIGLKLWLCPWMQLHHVGTYIFKGNLSALASVNAPMTASTQSQEKTYKKNPKKDIKLGKNHKQSLSNQKKANRNKNK